jgi:microcystin-dependent protein
MSEPFLGEIRIVSFTYPPKGWAFCNGQILPIAQNSALFSLLGTTYGGNGVNTFALPNLQGRVPIHTGNSFSLGQAQGEQTHTLTVGELPAHSHQAAGSQAAADQVSPSGALWAATPANAYSTSPTTSMRSSAVGSSGGGQPHENMPPYLTLNFCIALVGIFPSRN